MMTAGPSLLRSRERFWWWWSWWWLELGCSPLAVEGALEEVITPTQVSAREVLAGTCVGVITSSSSAPSTARGEPSYNHHHQTRPSHERSRLGPAVSSPSCLPNLPLLIRIKSLLLHPNTPNNLSSVQEEKRNNNKKKKELTTVSEVSPLRTIGNNTTGTTTGTGTDTGTGTGTGTPQAEPPSFFRALQTEYQSKIKRLQEENSSRRQLDETRRQLKQQHQLLVKERQDKKLRLAKTLSPLDAANIITKIRTMEITMQQMMIRTTVVLCKSWPRHYPHLKRG